MDELAVVFVSYEEAQKAHQRAFFPVFRDSSGYLRPIGGE